MSSPLFERDDMIDAEMRMVFLTVWAKPALRKAHMAKLLRCERTAIALDASVATLPCGTMDIRVGRTISTSLLTSDFYIGGFIGAVLLKDNFYVGDIMSAVVVAPLLGVGSIIGVAALTFFLDVGSSISTCILVNIFGVSSTILDSASPTVVCETIFLTLILVEGIQRFEFATFRAAFLGDWVVRHDIIPFK